MALALYEATRTNNLSLYKPYPQQRDFHNAGKDKTYRMFIAGNRCGKTYCGAVEMSMHLTGRYPKWWGGLRFTKPISGWLAGVSFGQPMEALMEVYLGGLTEEDFGSGSIPKDCIDSWVWNRNAANVLDILRVKHASGGVSKLKFMAYHQGREKFQAAKVHFIHLDEEPSIEIFAECSMRLAGTDGGMILTMTPLSGMSDTCMAFLEPKEEAAQDFFDISASWEDNPYLNERAKRLLKAATPAYQMEARSKGIPSLGSGKIYPVREEDIEVDPFEIPMHYILAGGMDFGWSNPTAAIFGATDPDTGITYLYHEYSESQRSPIEHVAALQHMIKNVPMVCDPKGENSSQADGTNVIAAYRDHGLDLTPADNSVESGLMKVLELMQSGRLKVFKGRCPKWLREFRLYQRDERGKVKKKDDHLMDATRYLIVSGLELARSPSNRLKSRDQVRSRPDWKTV